MGDSLAPSQPPLEGGCRPKACRRHVYESPERFAGEVHRANVRFAHDRVVLVVGDSDHQVVADNAATHAAAAQKREPAKHSAFGDVSPVDEQGSNASREFLVVAHISTDSDIGERILVKRLPAVISRNDQRPRHAALLRHGTNLLEKSQHVERNPLLHYPAADEAEEVDRLGCEGLARGRQSA